MFPNRIDGFDPLDGNPRILIFSAQPRLLNMVYDMGVPPGCLGCNRGVAGTDLDNPATRSRSTKQNGAAVLIRCYTVRDVRGLRQMICTPLPARNEI